MARTWYLDTETKGTGAHVAPLDRPRAEPSEDGLDLVRFRAPARKRSASGEPTASADGAPQFKVVDVMTSHVLAEGVHAAAAVALLEGMRSIVDARVYVRARGATRWRLLGFDEQRALWRLRGRARSSAAA